MPTTATHRPNNRHMCSDVPSHHVAAMPSCILARLLLWVGFGSHCDNVVATTGNAGSSSRR
eukprot:scaffold17917_cov93-Skeletonema_dohrnii-CCMP3373.AAC.1